MKLQNRVAERDEDEYIVSEKYHIGPTLRISEALSRTEKRDGRVCYIDGADYFIEHIGEEPSPVKGSYDWLRTQDGRKTITLLTYNHR